jgi:hypothetical protein
MLTQDDYKNNLIKFKKKKTSLRNKNKNKI